MRIFLVGFLGLLSLLLLPTKAECQSRSPIQDRRTIVRPPSNSRPPGGGRRPIQRSRRSMAIQPSGFDFGINIGTAHSLTDIGGTHWSSRPSFLDTQLSATSINLGAFGRYKINPLLAVTASANYGKIGGADSLSGENSSRYRRDFYFTNNILEFALRGELYLPKAIPSNPFDLYGFVGFAMFYHDPDLRVPNPENYEFAEYNNIQPAIPMGIGAFYTFPNNLRIGYEIGWRKTFFDYLDGFTRPASQGMDSYYFGKVKISYFLPDRTYARRGWFN